MLSAKCQVPSAKCQVLFHFLMRRVLAALAAELVELQPGRRGLLVLSCGVVAVLALSTLQCNDLSHILPRVRGGRAGISTERMKDQRISSQYRAPPLLIAIQSPRSSSSAM